MFVYLDQNYASRIAKFVRGQRDHEAFGEALAALRSSRPLVPPSPLHVLETRGGYLLPTLQTLFAEFSRGLWVRPHAEIIARQGRHGELRREDALTERGSWDAPADLGGIEWVLRIPLRGSFLQRAREARCALGDAFGLDQAGCQRSASLRLLARLVAFRSLDSRTPRESDAADLVMAATLAPYVDVLGTDRYVKEMLERIRAQVTAFSGRREDVRAFARYVRERA